MPDSDDLVLLSKTPSIEIPTKQLAWLSFPWLQTQGCPAGFRNSFSSRIFSLDMGLYTTKIKNIVKTKNLYAIVIDLLFRWSTWSLSIYLSINLYIIYTYVRYVNTYKLKKHYNGLKITKSRTSISKMLRMEVF